MLFTPWLARGKGVLSAWVVDGVLVSRTCIDLESASLGFVILLPSGNRRRHTLLWVEKRTHTTTS